MECNRDEAVRAKSIAESKLAQNDFFGAKRFALKAQTLYPGLDGISQMLATLEVYVSAENKINGEVDWYGVLCVNPSDDEETIKKQYRKLALMLHPDKNHSIGAEGAFKLILEAWTLLSDKAKRLAYDQRRGIGRFQHKVPTYTCGPSVHTHTTGGPSAQTGFGPSARNNFTSRTTTAPMSQKRRAKRPPSTPAPTPSYTFWTICRLCNTQYEYFKIYLNGTLLCPKCNKPFRALETAPPRVSKSSKRTRDFKERRV